MEVPAPGWLGGERTLLEHTASKAEGVGKEYFGAISPMFWHAPIASTDIA